MSRQDDHRLYDATSRVRDLALAVTAGFVTAPIWLGAAISIRLTMGRPILFRQERPGRGEVPFTLVKFRTMKTASDEANPESDEQRLTRLGRVLRSTSVDELPTLINVVRGDMALVGPRPLLMRYLDRYSPRQRRRHEVRPGITGLAQVSGRNALTWDEKFECDIWYVEHRSHRLDLEILRKTIAGVLRREGISAEGHATMPEFWGPLPSDANSS